MAYGSDGQVQVKVKDDCVNIASCRGNLILSPAARATANSSADDVNLCEGKPIQLSVNIINANYSWTGPNGFSSTLNSPVMPAFTAANNGTYSVTVTTTCGAQSTTQLTNATPMEPGAVATLPLPPLAIQV